MKTHFYSIQDQGCHQFTESEIIVKKFLEGSNEYLVLAEGELWAEVKMPFRMSDMRKDVDGSDLIEGFYYSLRLLHCPTDVPEVANLRGVVVDDGRKQLKSYLKEYFVFGDLFEHVIASATERNSKIPWEKREVWAK